jgi:hypothetical protein
MALDTNIALGVKPIEQPNMLAQMGQMMQLRQLQQENESNNALRDFYAQGGDINKAEDRQRLLSRAPMQGQKILGQESERRSRDVVTLGKEYDNARVGLTNVNDEAGYYNWVQSSFNNPAIAAHLTQMGITPEKALANARATVAKEGLSTAINKSAMGIGEFIKQDLQLQNATKNANIAAAPGHRNATVAENRFKNELDFGGESKPFLIQDPNDPKRTIEVEHRRDKRTGQWVPMGIQSPPMTIDISPSSASATLNAPTSGSGGVVNNLTLGAANVNSMNPNAPVVAANVPAPALATVRGAAPVYKDIVDPTNDKRMITINVNEYRGGSVNAKGERAPGVIGVAGKEPTAALREQKIIGAEDALKGELDNLRFAYGKLNEAEAIPSTARSGVSNLGASTQASDTGQFFGKVFGTSEQGLRDNIKSSNLRLLQSIKNATGMSAQELNSNMELKTWIDSLTNPKTAYETNIKNIDNIENFVKRRANRSESGASANTPAKTGDIADNAEIKAAMDWANSNPKDPRAAQIKQHFGAK